MFAKKAVFLTITTCLYFVLTLMDVSGVEVNKSFQLSADASCISAKCHNNMAKKKFIHAVAADGSTCSVCHKQTKKKLHNFKLAFKGANLCTQCHSNILSKAFDHAPAAAGACTFCHSPHQSDNPKQLNYPLSGELCFNCHDSSQFKGSTIHGPVKEGKCTGCHDPHTADHAKQLKYAMPELCFNCHSQSVTDFDGKIVPAVKPQLDKPGIHKHVPVAMGACVICHSPHATNNFRLLVAPYPKSFYSSFAEDKYVCFECHDIKAFAKIETSEATNFRNGTLNLHFRHVNRQKGRTCRACHHHHAGEYDALIRKNIPFGSRTIFISDYKRTTTGGSCSPTCHASVKYDRVKAVENMLKVSPRPGIKQHNKTQ